MLTGALVAMPASTNFEEERAVDPVLLSAKNLG
jgi:hypothetical protein